MASALLCLPSAIERLRSEIRAMERQELDQMAEALERCKTREEREACRDAYYDLILAHRDMIQQCYGLPGMLWRAIR